MSEICLCQEVPELRWLQTAFYWFPEARFRARRNQPSVKRELSRKSRLRVFLHVSPTIHHRPSYEPRTTLRSRWVSQVITTIRPPPPPPANPHAGLLPLLKSIQKPTHLRTYESQTLGVDTYGWLHRGTISCAQDLALGRPTTKYIDYVLSRVRMLQFFNVTPYLVFDGDYLPSKAHTEAERAERREQARLRGLELLKMGRGKEAQMELQKAVDVTPEMAAAVIAACRKVGVKCVVAPYEADAQLYYLEKMGEIDGVISEDSDMLVFGVKKLITKLDAYGECVEVCRDDFARCKEVSFVGWSDAEFRHMCILSGCDYLDNIPKLGLKTAHRLMRRHKDVEKILRVLQFEGSMSVPKGYLEAFRRADLTFRHQRVFDPKLGRLLMANEPEGELGDEDLIYIGPDIDEDVARGVAEGRLCPMTKRELVLNHGGKMGDLVRTSRALPEADADLRRRGRIVGRRSGRSRI